MREIMYLDLLFRDMFNNAAEFSPVDQTVSIPVDMYVDEDQSQVLEFAAVGSTKEDFDIKITDGNVLNVTRHSPKKKDDKREYQLKKISRKSFSIGLKVSSKYDLTKLTASMADGQLTIRIPVNKDKMDRTIKID